MASTGHEIGLVLVLVAMLWGGGKAQSSCNNVLTTLAPCVSYLTGNSSTPSASCCSQLGVLVQSSPDCLCSALNGNVPSLGISINRTIALKLPGACQVKTPAIDECKEASTPTASPSGSPTTQSPPSDQTPPASASGSGSKSTTDGSSDASITRAPIHSVLFLLSIASYALTISKF